MTITRKFGPLLAMAAVLGIAPMTQAQQAATITAEGPKAGLMGGGEVVTATVLSVDRKTRLVSLEAENGDRLEIVAGPEVKNLDQVKKGDILDVEYFEALALVLEEEKTGIQERIETTSGTTAAAGEKPAASTTRRIEVIATVMDVDKKDRLVVLKGPKQVMTVKVGDAVDLANIDKGDEVKAVYIEKAAISVRAPQ